MGFIKARAGVKLAGIIFSIISLIFLIIAIVCAYRANYFLNKSIVTTGKVVNVERTKSRDSDGHITIYNHLIIQFNDLNGNIVEFTNPVSSDNGFIYGEKVNVRYVPDNPKQAKTDDWSSVWFATLITGIFFVLFGVFGTIFLSIKS